jgi:putative flippase GtrA
MNGDKRIKKISDLLVTVYRSIRTRGITLLFESIKRTPSNDISVQVVRSLVVSVVALIADFGLLIIFKEVFGIHYLLAAALSFGIGVVVNYILSVRWVFAHRKLANRHAEFIIFLIICTAGLGLNLVIIAGLVQVFAVDYRIAKIVSTIVVFFWNFIARKKILY